MPRQLPWLNTGGGSRTQVKQPRKVKAGTKTPTNIDDDFLDGTVLASSGKGKAKAIRDEQDSDYDLPDLPAQPSTPRTKSRTKDSVRNRRAQSSSPPPIQDFIQPQIEYMHTGISKFDLRDDEWMMVEDEFLETAKLFTRHLHIAEYKKLKERIEAKKKVIDMARPVVVGGTMTFESKMKEKAKVQEKRQRKAIRDVFASHNDENEDEDEGADDVGFARPITRETTSPFASARATTTSKRPPNPSTPHNSNSDDLGISRPHSRSTAPKPYPTSALSSATTGPKSALPAPAPTHASITPSFAKPVLATKPRTATSHEIRATPFDMLDAYKPPANRLTAQPQADKNAHISQPSMSSVPSESHANPASILITKQADRSEDVKDDWGAGSALSKGTAERIAKRKAEREKERAEKRKAIKLEDIPTFLY